MTEGIYDEVEAVTYLVVAPEIRGAPGMEGQKQEGQRPGASRLAYANRYTEIPSLNLAPWPVIEMGGYGHI